MSDAWKSEQPSGMPFLWAFFSTLKLFAKHVSLREGTIQMDDRPAGTDGRHEVEGKIGENNLFESSRSTQSRGVVIADLK